MPNFEFHYTIPDGAAEIHIRLPHDAKDEKHREYAIGVMKGFLFLFGFMVRMKEISEIMATQFMSLIDEIEKKIDKETYMKGTEKHARNADQN